MEFLSPPAAVRPAAGTPRRAPTPRLCVLTDARPRITGCVARFDTGRSVVQDGASLEQWSAADQQQYPDASSPRNDTASLPSRIDAP